MERLKNVFGTAQASENLYDLNWAVIQCYWRERLSVWETAEVFGVDEETIEFEIAIQNAK